MGRTRAWEEDDVLAAARRVFREHGYSGTSMRHLQDATGVHPGSLYRTYGDKRGLFAAALRSYNQKVVEERVAHHLSADDAAAGLRSFFSSTFTSFVDGIPGCLVTNSAVECVTLDPSLRADVVSGLQVIERGLGDALDRLAAEGRLRPGIDPPTQAQQLLALYEGLLVLVRCGTPKAKLARMVDSTMSMILAEDVR